MGAEDKTIGLSVLTEALRSEIDRMQTDLASQGKDPVLELDEAKIELTVGIEISGERAADVGFKVFGIGFGASATDGEKSVNTHKFTLVLKPPLDGNGRPMRPGVASHETS